jgi:hypothetical protein
LRYLKKRKERLGFSLGKTKTKKNRKNGGLEERRNFRRKNKRRDKSLR